MSKDEKPPCEDKYIWRRFAIGTLLLILHYAVYEITVSDDATAKSFVTNILDVAKPFIPGSGGFKSSRLPYEIPLMQLALAVSVTLPLALFFLMPMAQGDFDRALELKKRKNPNLEHAVFDVQLFSVLGMLMMLLVLFIPPSSIFIGAAKSSFFGILAPIKYALCSYAMANLIWVFFLSCRVPWR